MTGFEQRLKVQQLYWGALICGGALFVGFFIAYNPLLMFAAAALLVWGLLLPFHTRLATFVAAATFSSAFIVPFFPGRPYVWEAAALLGWSGLVITIAMRRYPEDIWNSVRANPWLFLSIVGYCAVLVATMIGRGVGLRILGNEQMGGRFYFQQLSCAVFPLLFLFCRLDERTLTRLYLVQCLLTATYLVSDFVFSVAPQQLFFILQFFELPGDAGNFETQAVNFGIRRFQSLAIFGQGFTFLLLVLFGLRDFLAMRGLFLLPMAAGIFTVGLLSGHRWMILIVGGTLVICAYAQRFFTFRNCAVGVAVTVLALTIAYGYSDRMPMAAQRALSVLPGIDISNQARADGEGTLETRRMLRRIGWEMIPDYFWLGRGFGQPAQDYSYLWDPTAVTSHVNQGRFYNGFIGLMVNTGVFGTACMLLFLSAGTFLAWRIIRYLRWHGCETVFDRVCCVVAGLWITNVFAFLALHGDSEYAMKTFSLQAGLLLACNRCLGQRVEPSAALPPAARP
jgi:hypothetical protein